MIEKVELKVKIKVKVAWWYKFGYLPFKQLSFVIRRFFNPQATVDLERIKFWLDKAVTTTVDGR